MRRFAVISISMMPRLMSIYLVWKSMRNTAVFPHLNGNRLKPRSKSLMSVVKSKSKLSSKNADLSVRRRTASVKS